MGLSKPRHHAAEEEGRQEEGYRQEEGFRRRWQGQEEEVVKGQGQGKGHERCVLRQGAVREVRQRGAQVQADHSFRHFRAYARERLARSSYHQGPHGQGSDSPGFVSLQSMHLHSLHEHMIHEQRRFEDETTTSRRRARFTWCSRSSEEARSARRRHILSRRRSSTRRRRSNSLSSSTTRLMRTARSPVCAVSAPWCRRVVLACSLPTTTTVGTAASATALGSRPTSPRMARSHRFRTSCMNKSVTIRSS